jgi:dihydrofolate synthase/folylpolyglutamate synthase
VIVSQRQKEIELVFQEKASIEETNIVFASDKYSVTASQHGLDITADNSAFISQLLLPLKGNYQFKNLPGVLCAIDQLIAQRFMIPRTALISGLENVISQTGLKGRWQQLSEMPTVICDTGHNEDGVKEVVSQLAQLTFNKLHMVWGMVKDKDIAVILSLLPTHAHYYFCQASIPRAMDAAQLRELAKKHGLSGKVIRSVNEAIKKAKDEASINDLIFIGGSTFVVAEIENL